MTSKTIRGPRAILDKWVDALRYGGYKQGKGALKQGDTYCCLGVLQMCVDGVVEMDPFVEGVSMGLPTQKWLDDHGLTMANNPYLPTLKYGAACANDAGKSFDEIADAIEAAMEYTD